jgi:ketosteroid isomerase-like protein
LLKVMLLLKRHPSLSMAEFVERYESMHVPAVMKNATKLRHYERHYLHPGRHVIFGDEVAEPEYDVLTELWYDDMAALDEQQDWLRSHPDRVAAVIEDEGSLFDRTKSRLAFVEDRLSDLGHEGYDDHQPSHLNDRSEIADLVHLYSFYVDRRRYDELAELFTEDCLVDYGPGLSPPIHGRTAFRGIFGIGKGFEATSHHNANILITFEGGDRARVSASLYAWHRRSDGTTPQVWGSYDDVVVRTSDGWRFAERRLRVAGTEDWDAEWHPLA